MPVGTSDGQYHENDFDYWHSQLFGQKEEQSQGDNKLYLVRHGDTALNDEDLVHGWVDEPLNEAGIEQAHKAAKSLENKDITRIVSSDLPRAKQTANIISKATGTPVTFDPNLRTWDSGDLDFTDKHAELDKYAQAVPRDQKNVPTMKIPKELHKPDHELGDPRIEALPEGHPDRRVFGRMIDHMQKMYEELGIRHNDHFYIEGDPQEYRRMTPEESENTDFDFIKVFPPDDKVASANTPPPGSSESFNQFKDRMITALTGHAANNGGHNTVVVTHSKGIGVMNAWEHAGYPEDQSIHQATYDKKDDIKPGGHEELSIPEHVLAGVDLNPVHNPGTQPKDYLTELLHDPDILDKNIEQAGNFNFVGGLGKRPYKYTKMSTEMPSPREIPTVKEEVLDRRDFNKKPRYNKGVSSKETSSDMSDWVEDNGTLVRRTK